MNSKGKQHLQKSKKKVENIPLIWVNDMTNRKGKLKKQKDTKKSLNECCLIDPQFRIDRNSTNQTHLLI